MRLIERRIGLLFAGFLLCFLVIVGRAFWLQGVQGGALASEAISQQTETVTVPGLRGSLLDRSGNELAASEDAATIYATPYQVEEPAAGGGETGPDPRTRTRAKCWKPDRRLRLLLHRPQSQPRTGGADRTAEAGRDRRAARQPPHLPAGGNGGAGDRRGRLRKPGPDRPRGGRGIDPEGERRRTPHRPRRARRPDPAGNREGSERRRRHPADPRPADPAEDRTGAGRSRRNLRAEGGDGDRRRPAQLADPGDGQLAADRPQRPLRRQQRRPD